MKIEYRQN